MPRSPAAPLPLELGPPLTHSLPQGHMLGAHAVLSLVDVWRSPRQAGCVLSNGVPPRCPWPLWHLSQGERIWSPGWAAVTGTLTASVHGLRVNSTPSWGCWADVRTCSRGAGPPAPPPAGTGPPGPPHVLVLAPEFRRPPTSRPRVWSWFSMTDENDAHGRLHTAVGTWRHAVWCQPGSLSLENRMFPSGVRGLCVSWSGPPSGLRPSPAVCGATLHFPRSRLNGVRSGSPSDPVHQLASPAVPHVCPGGRPHLEGTSVGAWACGRPVPARG